MTMCRVFDAARAGFMRGCIIRSLRADKDNQRLADAHPRFIFPERWRLTAIVRVHGDLNEIGETWSAKPGGLHLCN